MTARHLSASRVLETALYVEDPTAAARFYEGVLGLRRLVEDERLVALDAGAGTVLLLFRRGASLHVNADGANVIPAHDGHGPLHVAFAVDEQDLGRWEQRLAEQKVPVESRVQWPRGGTSLYFRDPDEHLVELATPGVWETY